MKTFKFNQVYTRTEQPANLFHLNRGITAWETEVEVSIQIRRPELETRGP